MASPSPSNSDRTNARTGAISGALQLAKQVVLAQLHDTDPIVLDGIKASFARLEQEALGACLLVSPPPVSLPAALPSLPPASLAPASLPPAPASDQPEPIAGPKADTGSEELVHPAEKGDTMMSQSGETSQPPQDDKAGKKDWKKPGPFLDSSDEEKLLLAHERKIQKRQPTKYPAVNEANYVRDGTGSRMLDPDAFGLVYKLKKPWMKPWEEEEFFAKQSFERCYKCVELGHSMENCPQQKPRCRRCDRPHRTRDCRSSSLKCGVCGGQHVRGREGCRPREIEMLKEKLLIQYYAGDLS